MDTPSARIIAASQSAPATTDAEGRILTLRRLTALDKLRLFKAAGPTLTQNHLWLGMATLACSVTAIDDVPVPSPANEAQIEALVGKLGDSGINAIAAVLAPADPIDVATHAGN